MSEATMMPAFASDRDIAAQKVWQDVIHLEFEV